MSEKITPQQVSESFANFMELYDEFRKSNGLTKGIDNIYEVLTGMTDKHGRICRQIKHFERNDQKPDWPGAVGEAMTGYFIYMMMVLDKYNIEISESMCAELESAIRQYAEE